MGIACTPFHSPGTLRLSHMLSVLSGHSWVCGQACGPSSPAPSGSGAPSSVPLPVHPGRWRQGVWARPQLPGAALGSSGPGETAGAHGPWANCDWEASGLFLSGCSGVPSRAAWGPYGSAPRQHFLLESARAPCPPGLADPCLPRTRDRHLPEQNTYHPAHARAGCAGAPCAETEAPRKETDGI